MVYAISDMPLDYLYSSFKFCTKYTHAKEKAKELYHMYKKKGGK